MYVRLLGCCLIAIGFYLAPAMVGASTPVEALLKQAEAIRSSDPTAFQQLLQQLDRLRSQATPAQREQLDYLKAYSEVFSGRYDAAIHNTRRLIESTSDVDMKVRAGALAVNAHTLDRQFTEGLRQLEKILSLMEQVDNPDVRQQAQGVATEIYNQIGQSRLALQYADQILAQSPSARIRCFAGQARLDALQRLGELPADDAPIKAVIRQCIDQGEIATGSLVRINLARKWAANGQRDGAIKLLQHYLAVADATNYPYLIGEYRSLLAELQFDSGDVAGAELNAQAVIALDKRLTNSKSLAAAYKTMYEIAELRGDTEAAFASYRRYAESSKDYLNDVKARELAYQIVRHEGLRTTQQIELLNQQNQVLQLRQQVSEQSAQNSRLLIALLAVLLLSIGYWAWRIKRGHRALSKLAQTDALTGVCNRQHFTRLAQEALTRRARRGDAAALVMFDLDHFKNVNDRHGHITGDWTLIQVVDSCRECCGPKDYIGRLGGEEFAILIRGRDLKAATQLAEACRTRIARIDTAESGHVFSVTASFGVTSTALSGYDLTTLLANADDALYRAKHEGRNRVCTYSGEMTQASPEVPAPTMRLRSATVD